MWHGLTLIHRPGTRTFRSEDHGLSPAGWVLWRTCLRGILVGFVAEGEEEFAPNDVLPEDSHLRGEAAYAFLLEVICGLHSRVLGENEILAQFKARFLEPTRLGVDVSPEFSGLVQALLADAKRVRTAHRLNRGSHSYGSFARKTLGVGNRVSILGTGELARAVIPWLLDTRESIQVLYRSEAGRESLLRTLLPEEASRLSFVSLTRSQSVDLSGGLIIAAPISSAAVAELTASAAFRPTTVIDYRAEAKSDPVSVGIAGRVTIGLEEFFREMETVTHAGRAEKSRALATIRTLLEARSHAQSMQIRTQGWEDLCG